MFPLILAARGWPVILAGRGPALGKRLTLLDAAGMEAVTVYAPGHDEELGRAAGTRLVARLPTEPEVTAARVLLLAGLSEAASADLAGTARAHRVLLNVEDNPALCDFHVPAQVRRGDLLLTASTAGRSPALAVWAKERLSRLFPPEWESRVAAIGELRDELRAAGADLAEVSRATRAALDAIEAESC